MKLKIRIYSLLFMIFGISCNESIIDPQKLTQEQLQAATLKLAPIGTNYYVANTGNDSNPGTSSSPFLTIQKAADVVHPGDNVIIRDGVYSSATPIFVLINRSGTSRENITFRSENKWGAVLDGSNTSDYCIELYQGASYVKFINFEIKNFLSMGFFCNDSTYQSNYITIYGNKIHDIGRVDDTEPFGRCAVYLRKENHDWTIDKNLIYNIGRTGPDTYWMNKDHAVYTGMADSLSNAAHHINVTSNVIFGVSGNALNICSNNDLIANNVFAWTNENSQGGSNFVTMEGPGVANETIANNIFYQPPMGSAYAIFNYTSATSWIVKNNMVYGGSLWYYHNADNTAAMKGGNYGQNDCENGEADPLFVSAIRTNAPNVDFSLQAGSPAINVGVDVGLKTDFLFKPFIGLPDIGAYEYTTIPKSSPTAN